MNDEQFFLANAYLDGELTVEERAIADADPEVMAAVEELRALQALVRDVDPPSSATRDAAMAAAMAAFVATDTAAPRDRRVPDPIPFRPRPSYAKYLAVAAGVLGVGLFGVAVVNLDTGGDDDSADESAAEEPADEPAAELDRATEDQPLVADGGDDADQEVATAEAPDEDAADEPVMDDAEEPAEEPADEPAEEPADEPATGVSLPRPEVTPGQVLTTPEELGSYGTDLLEQQSDGTLGATPNHACPIDDVLGRAEYQVGDEIVPILVAVDEPNGIVLAFADETCEAVAEGPLYLP